MITILNENDYVVAILENDESEALSFTNDRIYEKLNDAYLTLNFRTSGRQNDGTIHPDAKQLIGGHKVVYPDKTGTLQIFTIRTVDEVEELDGSFYKDVYAEHLALELNGTIIRPQTFKGLNAQQFATQIIGGTRWKLGLVEWLGIQDITFDEYTSGIQAFIKGAEEFGGEFKFRAEMAGGKISGLYVDLVERRGLDTGIQIEYEHNMKTVKRTEDTSQIFTALIGLARGTSEDNENGYMTFTNVQAADKPLGQDYIGSDTALQKYGVPLSNGEKKHYMGVYLYEGNEIITPGRLLEHTRARLKEVSVPQFTYETTFQDLSQITGYEFTKFNVGDTISISNLDFSPPLLVSARIVEAEYGSNPEDSNVVLGEYKDIWRASQVAAINALRNTVMKNAAEWEAGIAAEEAARISRVSAASVSVQEAQARKTSIDEQAARVTASGRLEDQTIRTRITTAQTNYNAAHADYVNQVNAAVSNNEIDDTEQSSIDSQRNVMDAAESELISAIQSAETNIQDNIESAAGEVARTEAQTAVTEYAEKKVYRGSIAPDATFDPPPEENDLWLDTSLTDAGTGNPVWKQFIGGAWRNLTRVNLDEMLGQLASQQLSNNAITAEKIVDGAISEVKLGQAVVTEAKLATGSVTNAKLGANAVTAAKILDGAILEAKLAANAVTEAKLAENSVSSAKILDGAISELKIGLNAVTSSRLADNAVQASKIVDGAINDLKLAADAVTEAKIASGAVGSDAIKANAVTASKILAGSIAADHIAADAITSAKISAGAIGTDELAANAVTAAKILAGSIGTDQLAANSVTATKILAGSITTSHIVSTGIDAKVITAGTINAARVQIGAGTTFAAGYDPSTKATVAEAEAAGTAAGQAAAAPANERIALWQYADTVYIDGGSIYANSITANQIAAGSVTADELAANSVTAAKILAGSIGTDQLSANAVTAAKILAGSIGTTQLAADAVTAEKIAANSVTASELAANAVTASKILAGSIGTDQLAANSVTAGKLLAGTVTTSHISTAGIDAAVLAANTVIAQDITFKGILSGATGSFSGAVTSYYSGMKNGNNIGRAGTLEDGYLSVGYDEYYQGSQILSTNMQMSEDRIDYSADGGSGWFTSNSIEMDYQGDIRIIAAQTGLSVSYNDVVIRNLIAQGNAIDVPSIYSRSTADIYGVTNMRSDAAVYGRLRGSGSTSDILVNGFYTDRVESGWCGVGGHAYISGVQAGAWQSFRTRKTYVPASIAISTGYINGAQQANLTAYSGILTTAITEYGFWLYIQNQTTGAFRYWRGTYSA